MCGLGRERQASNISESALDIPVLTHFQYLTFKDKRHLLLIRLLRRWDIRPGFSC